jgi:hypothetical protein
MISETAIKEFQRLYLREYGCQLSFEEAHQLALSLLRFYKTLLQKQDKGYADGEGNS